MKNQSVQGMIIVTRSGAGFVPHEDFDEDIYVSKDKLGTALNGDTVEVKVTRSKRSRAEGVVDRVLERRTEEFVGVLKNEKGTTILVADDPRMYAQMHIRDVGGAKDGDKVIAKIVLWENSLTGPIGEVSRVIGEAGKHETEMQSTIITHGFEETFPEDVLKEAEKIGERGAVQEDDLKNRRDFRSVPTCTIDPVDAKDFDDALSIQHTAEGNTEVGIHIADVTHYVRTGTTLDTEARKRATSVYLVDRVIPMLPEVLSNNICSLRPDEDRLAFSAVFTFNKNGEVIDRWFGKSVIRSQKRFSYQDAQDVLDTKKGPFQEELAQLQTLANALRKEREKKGAISFETDEVRFELDDNGKPIRVYVKDRLETMKLIEEFMLLANREVAEWIGKHCKDKKEHERTFIYRIHDNPDPDKLEELRIFLKAIGHDLGKEGHQIVSKDIDNLLREVRGKPEEALIQMATLRSMAKAVYSHKNIGHFSLGFQNYTHFTSPIRRYPDMIAHRILSSHLTGPLIGKKEMEAYQKAAITASEREVAAVAAERDSVKYKQVEFMEAHVGETFEASITGVAEHGLYVAEKESKAEGLVHISALGDDYYDYNSKLYALVGKRTGKKFRLGDTIKVILVGADVERKQIDWKLA